MVTVKQVGVALAVALVAGGCGSVQVTEPLPGAERVRIVKGDAPADAVEVGPIEATSGYGCGAFGERGTYTTAYAVLRNEAVKVGANLVRIDSMREPYFAAAESCYHNEFTIQGVAFRVASPAPSARAPAVAPPAAK